MLSLTGKADGDHARIQLYTAREPHDMDQKTVAAVTRALDATITKVAGEQLRWLSSGLPPDEIAERIHQVFRSFQRLTVAAPDYDGWHALLYALWYQPSQINLAYTLARKVPKEKSPLRTGNGRQVIDFGCGALAMQFGLALAAADSLEELKVQPRVAIISEDSSTPMRDMGLNFGSISSTKSIMPRSPSLIHYGACAGT